MQSANRGLEQVMEILLMLVGAFAVYFILTKLYGSMWTRNLDADIRFSTESAVSGDRIELIETVTNDKWLPLPFVNVKFRMERGLSFYGAGSNSNETDKSYKNDVFSLLFHQRITRRIPIQCKRRGLYCVDSIEILSKGIFMSEIMSFKKELHRELTVYPEISDVSRIEILNKAVLGDLLVRYNLHEDPFEIRGIRDYSTHDTMKQINWKASARTNELKVNLHDYTAGRTICILLNLESEGMLVHEDLLEESISIAAGLAQSLNLAGASVGIISNGRDKVTGESINIHAAGGLLHINAINTALARIDLSLEMQPFEELLAKADEQSVCVLISSSAGKNLQREYDGMCESGRASVWIFPHNAGENMRHELCPHAKVLTWEVASHE